MRILLIDDHELFRSGIKFLLTDLAPELSFAEASNCTEALRIAAGQDFDIVLVDYHLPGATGLDAVVLIRDQVEDAASVVLSAEEDPAVIRRVIDAGATGFIPKSASHAIMLAALRLVLAGGTYLPPHALHAARAANSAGDVYSPQALKGLTERQLDTLQLAIQGKANKIIARDLDISEATVKAHLSAAFRALGVRNRTEAVFAAAKLKLFT